MKSQHGTKNKFTPAGVGSITTEGRHPSSANARLVIHAPNSARLRPESRITSEKEAEIDDEVL